MSDTPQTDATLRGIIFACKTADQLDAMADHARNLERENAALREDRERLKWFITHSTVRDFGLLSDDYTEACKQIDAARKETQP